MKKPYARNPKAFLREEGGAAKAATEGVRGHMKFD